MSVTNALWVNGISVADARLNMGALIATDSSSATDVRPGLFFTPVSVIDATSTTSPSMTVMVDAFHYVGIKANSEGPYIGTHPANEAVSVAAAPATGARIDVIYVMQRDADAATSPDGFTAGELGIVTGTAATSPTKPSIPAGAVEVGTVRVAAGATKTTDATVTITETALWTSVRGAATPVRNTTERAAITPSQGRMIYRLDTDRLEIADGSTWRAVDTPTAKGTFSVSPAVVGPDEFATFTITFPAGLFASAPIVTANSSSRLVCFPKNVTTSGATIEVYNPTSANSGTSGVSVGWQAF